MQDDKELFEEKINTIECNCGCSIIRIEEYNDNKNEISSFDMTFYTLPYNTNSLWSRLKLSINMLLNKYYGEHYISIDKNDFDKFKEIINKVNMKYNRG